MVPVDGSDTVRERGGHQIEAHIDRTTNILDSGAVRHQEHALLVQRTESHPRRLAIGRGRSVASIATMSALAATQARA